MTVSESSHEPTLFDQLPNKAIASNPKSAEAEANAKPPAQTPPASESLELRKNGHDSQTESAPSQPTLESGAAGAAEAPPTGAEMQPNGHDTTHHAGNGEVATEPKKEGRKKGAKKAPKSSSLEPQPSEGNGGLESASHEDSAEPTGNGSERSPRNERQRLEEQLQNLKRKEAELRCALIATDHPELAEPVGEIQSRAHAISRVEEKLAQGLSKGEVRRREALEKKLNGLRAKRDELDEQIATLEQEHAELGVERMAQFEAERQEALELLMAAFATHADSLKAAGIDPKSLVPDMQRWWPELESIAMRASIGSDDTTN